jgi:hypothetical protein
MEKRSAAAFAQESGQTLLLPIHSSALEIGINLLPFVGDGHGGTGTGTGFAESFIND